MGHVKVFLEKVAGYYRVAALIFFNVVILFAAINLIADAGLDIREYFRKSAAGKGAPFSYRNYRPSLDAVYPDLNKDEIGRVIHESRRVTQEYETYTQFKEKPYDARYFKVDPHGFRHIKNQGPWPPRDADFTIFVFGGSTTFGYGVPGQHTIASHLQELMSSAIDPSARVYNFGRGGYISVQERLLFEKLIASGFAPDVAVFIDGLNDFAQPDGKPARTDDLTKFMSRGDEPAAYALMRDLPIAKALLSLLPESGRGGSRTAPPRGGSAKTKGDDAGVIEKVVERYLINKKMIEAVSSAFRVTPVFVWQPVPVHEYDQRYNIFGGFNYGRHAPVLEAGYAMMAKMSKSEAFGKDFIWCADIQKGYKKPLYVDAVHYSGEMAKMIAKRIIDVMRTRNLLPSKRGRIRAM